MDEKPLLMAVIATLQRMPAGVGPADTVANLVITNNRIVAEAASAMMTLETVPQPHKRMDPVARRGKE